MLPADIRKAWTYWADMGVVRKFKVDGSDQVEFVNLKERLYGKNKAADKKPQAESPAPAKMILSDKSMQNMYKSIERILGRVMNGTEMMEILSWINDYNAAPEIIVYAYSHCKGKNIDRINYVGAVVKRWVDEGLNDVLAVEEFLARIDQRALLYKRVYKALGFIRNATEEEMKIMDRWFDEMGYDIDKVLEACKKTSEQGKGADIKADIDLFVPHTDKVNDNTFVVIIANEAYQKLAKVNYAIKDGQSFAQYCNLTLGIPHENIRTYHNATYGRMLESLADLKSIAEVYEGELNVIFYYCGHGAPDESSKESYLLPVDAFKISPNVCLSLKKLYGELSEIKAEKVTVFLDACFSGATRAGEMLASARGTAIKPREEVLTGNIVSFTASSGNETALQYDEKGHGMFTYYLLKKLQETKGNVSLGELSDYVKKKVLQKSVVINRKKQTPTLNYSQQLKDIWQKWTF